MNEEEKEGGEASAYERVGEGGSRAYTLREQQQTRSCARDLSSARSISRTVSFHGPR